MGHFEDTTQTTNKAAALVAEGNELRAQGKWAAARNRYENAYVLIANADPQPPSAQTDLTAVCRKLGSLSREEGDINKANGTLHQALTHARAACQAQRCEQTLRDHAAIHVDLGDLYLIQGEPEIADSHFVTALAFLQDVAEPRSTETERDIAVCRVKLGDSACMRGQLGAAEKQYRIALEAFLPHGAAAESPLAESDLSAVYKKTAHVLYRQEELSASMEMFMQALRIDEQRAQNAPSVTAREALAASCTGVGNLHRALGNTSAAKQYIGKAVDIHSALARETQTVSAQSNLATAYYNMAMLCEDKQEKQTYAKQSLDMWQTVCRQSPENAEYQRRRDLLIRTVTALGD